MTFEKQNIIIYAKNKKTLAKLGQNVVAGESLIAEE